MKMTFDEIIEWTRTLTRQQNQVFFQSLSYACFLNEKKLSDNDYKRAITKYLVTNYPNKIKISTGLGTCVSLPLDRTIKSIRPVMYKVLLSLRDKSDIVKLMHTISADGRDVAKVLRRSGSFLISDRLRASDRMNDFDAGYHQDIMKAQYHFKMREQEKAKDEISMLVDKIVEEPVEEPVEELVEDNASVRAIFTR